MYAWLDDALLDSAGVVSASRRLARVLHAAHAEEMASAGHVAWRSPSILSLHDWLTKVLSDSSDPASLPIQITAQQSRVLWERCLRREIADPLLNIGMLARQSRDAWKKLQEWQVPIAACQQAARNKDQAIYAKAAISYCSILDQENWVDESMLADLVRQELVAGRCRAPVRLTLAGFDRITPQLQSLIDVIQSAGGKIHRAPTSESANKISLRSAENNDGELRSAGAWARDELERSPKLRIAIVVTHLEQDSQRCLRLIKEGLIPGWQNAGTRYNSAIDVSYGRKLVEYPAVSIALLALRWLHDDLSTVDVSRLLQSSLISTESMHDRVRVELRLRQQPDQAWSPKQLLAEVSTPTDESRGAEANGWIRRLAERRDQMPKRQSAASWVSLFHEMLQELMWPGSASLDSAEFQLINRWRELLNDFARLDLVISSMTASEALGRIGSIASEVIFQAEAKQAVVQILGPLEAAGLQFDSLWVTGVSASNWPPRGAPISLVSRDLQREYKMPDATPNDTLAYAKRVITRLMSTGTEVVVSYPMNQGDAQQAPSELLHEHEVNDGGELSDPGWNAVDVSKESSGLEIASDPVPAFQRGELLSGGAGTIQRQFVEPFAAFATGRLGIRLLWPIMSGLSASIRGSLIHTALHRLYEECPSRDEISAWDDAEVEARSTKAIQAAFWPQERNADPVLRCLLQIERGRVKRLLQNVIRVDAAREQFHIDSVEQAASLNIGELALRLRIDRVDVESDGQLLILDYKTGTAKKMLDRDKNPKDMQLVVYACAMDRTIGGLGLLNVDSRGVVLDGAGQQLTPKLDWDEALGNWKGQVETAAKNIVAGDVRINALQSAQAARPLSLLSRHRELSRE